MKNLLTIAFVLILSQSVYAQIHFEKAYFIDNNDVKTNCLIKNVDWKNNPTHFDYKLSDNSEIKSESIKNVKEFGILNTSKYVRFNVNIDRSPDYTSNLSLNRNPEFVSEELFLKTLVEGTASLFYFEDGNLKRFFYKTDTIGIEQLIYKPYLIGESKIGYNIDYKQQIRQALNCASSSEKELELMTYSTKALANYFVKYNACRNSNYLDFVKNSNKGFINLSIRPGFNFSSLNIENNIPYLSHRNADFGSKINPRLGMEVELVLPFNKNKWALVIEPTFQYFNGSQELMYQDVEVSYKSIELPIGLRYYLFLDDNSKIYFNATMVLDFDLNSIIDYTNTGEDLEIETRNTMAFGLGYKYKNIYSFEFRYFTIRNLLIPYISWTSEYNTYSFVFGYTLFNNSKK
jgi:hypothetical protein